MNRVESHPPRSTALLTSHRRAVLQAFLVTFLWSTSWVLIKLGSGNIPALTFAGLRYTLAAVCLLPFLLHAKNRSGLRVLTGRDWIFLAVLGLVYISIAQGTVFVGLAALPAVTVSLALNFSAPAVALFGVLFINERPSLLQWAGMALFLVGVGVYFLPVQFPAGQWLALGWVGVGMLATSAAAVMGRAINRSGRIPALVITTISMVVGGPVLLAVGLASDGLPVLTLIDWLIITWLALINTAFAFTLWNVTQRTLTAVESSMINNSILIQIAVLAWIFLGEGLTIKTGFGLLAAGAGTLLVQLKPEGARSE